MAFKPYATPGLLPSDNPLSQWVAPRRNALLGFGSGMLSSNWGDIGKSTMQGMALDREYAMDAQEQIDKEQSKNATIEWLQSQGYTDLVQMAQATGDIGAAWSEGLKRSQPQAANLTANQNDFLFAQQNGYGGSFEDWVRGDQRNPALGTTIYTGRDENGNVIPMQVGNDGAFVPTQMPEGISFDPGALNAERAYGTQVGTGRGKAEVAAPEAIATAQRTLTQIQQLKSDPGLWWSVGGMGWTPNMPGNPQAGTISRIEQLQGAAFLEAFESLKGGGQITEVEGAKATNAMARLQRSQSYEEFVQALTDLEEVINVGLQRAMRQSQGGAPVPPMGGAGSQPSGVDDILSGYGL